MEVNLEYCLRIEDGEEMVLLYSVLFWILFVL